jgi:hypothetical protein
MTHPFVRQFNSIMTDETIRAVDKMVVAVLWFRKGSNEDCWPSIPRLVKDVGADRKTIMAATKRLADLGKITIHRKAGCENRYELITSANNGTGSHVKSGTGSSPKKDIGSPVNQSQKRDLTSPKNGTQKRSTRTNTKRRVPDSDESASLNSQVYNFFIEQKRTAHNRPEWLPTATQAKQLRANIKILLEKQGFKAEDLLSWLKNFFLDEKIKDAGWPWKFFMTDPIRWKEARAAPPIPPAYRKL